MLLAALLAAWPAPQVAAPVPARARAWGDFPVFVWREQYAGRPLPEELAHPFGGVILMRDEGSDWARAQGLSYLVWNVAGREALHLEADPAWEARVERWIATHDEELLVREPCWNQADTRARLAATLEATLARHGRAPGLGFVLGDEVSLTPNGDPFDLCRCGACEALWREHARVHGWPERAPLTDEVRQGLLEDDFSRLGPWMARRRFDQELLLALLEQLATQARGAHERSVALLGMKGRTPFGGVDAGRAARLFDVLEGYAVGETLPLLASSARAAASSPLAQARLATLFLEGEAPSGAAWLAWDSWLRGMDGLVLWQDRALADEALRARLAQAVAAIRAIEARFPDLARPTLARAGLVSDADSLAVAWLKEALLDGPTWPRRRQSYSDAHGPRGARIRAWIAAAEALGEPLGATSFGQLARFPVLLLPEVLVLDEADVRELEAHLDGGGTLVLEGELGWVDRAGRPWGESVAERLALRAPERVLTAPGAEGLAAFARRLLAPRTLVTDLGAGAPTRWTSSRRSTGSARSSRGKTAVADADEADADEFVLACLPAAGTPAERAALRPLALAPASPYALERIFPPPGAELAPGDAAVFLVRTGSPAASDDALPEPR